MKANMGLVEVTVRNKISELAFATIVTEAFVKALPFSSTKLDKSDRVTLAEYSKACIEQLGGIKALESAITNEKDVRRRILLSDIYRTCMESATEVSKRVVKECDGESSLEELVADAGFTKKEYNDFQTRADSLDLDKIAEIVKSKVIDTLKTEKEDHARVDNINVELSDAIRKDDEDHKEAMSKINGDDQDELNNVTQDGGNEETGEENSDPNSEDDGNDYKKLVDDITSDSEDSDDENEESKDPDDLTSTQKEAKESFVHLVTGSTKTMEHRSLFSSLQQAACEQIIYNEEALMANDIDLHRLLRVTSEHTFPQMRHEKTAMESLEDLASVVSTSKMEENLRNMHRVIECATITSTIAYTMLESLHTMNLLPVTVNDVRIAVESSNSMEFTIKQTRKRVDADLKKACMKMAKESLLGLNTVKACDEKHADLERAIGLMKICVEGVDPSVIKTFEDRDKAICEQKKLLQKKAPAPAEEGYYGKLKRERNIVQMNRIARLASAIGPSVSEIVIEQTTDEGSYDVHISRGGNDTVNTFITLEGVEPNANSLRNLVESSNLNRTQAPDVYFRANDGKGGKTLLH